MAKKAKISNKNKKVKKGNAVSTGLTPNCILLLFSPLTDQVAKKKKIDTKLLTTHF